MEVKFYWSNRDEVGHISAADRERLLKEHWVLAADFLNDVIGGAQVLYEEVLEKRNVE